MKIKWTKRASENLSKVLSHIAQDNQNASKKFLALTLEKVDSLETFPLLGRAGIVSGTRELVIHENYIVYYRIQDEQVQILRLLHVKRQYP
jgi:toxin ParE1/3/4